MDVAHFNDQIYALCDNDKLVLFLSLFLVKNGKLVHFEPDAPLADMVQVIVDHPQDVGAH